MKILRNVLILSVFAAACGGDNSDMNQGARDFDRTPGSATEITAQPQQDAPPQTLEPAQNEEGTWHYICPNGCEGGAGSAETCGGCGATLIHNTGYHANATTTTTQPQQVTGEDGQPEIIPSPPPTTEPAQNANGVWHYTCPNGCAGGAGSAGPCPTCGSQLQHNAAYHQ